MHNLPFCIFSSLCSVNIVMFMLALENMSPNLLMVGFIFVGFLFLITQEPSINFKVYGQFSSLTIIMEIIVHHKLICVRKNLAFMFFHVVLFVCFDRFFLLNL